MSPHTALADVLVVAHLGFVVFVVAGGVLVPRWPRVAWAHVPPAAWGAWIARRGAPPRRS